MPTKILIVDDHFLFAETLGKMIRELPEYELVGIAVTGPQTVSMAQETQPEVILLDYHLPGYSAEQLIPRINNASPSSRVIILTSDLSEASLVKGIQAGVAGYLTKDRALADIFQALDSVAKGQSILTDEQLAQVPEAVCTGEPLTEREVEILQLLARGRETVAIAEDLTISSNTVRTHIRNIFTKLGAHTKLEAVTIAGSRGLL